MCVLPPISGSLCCSGCMHAGYMPLSRCPDRASSRLCGSCGATSDFARTSASSLQFILHVLSVLLWIASYETLANHGSRCASRVSCSRRLVCSARSCPTKFSCNRKPPLEPVRRCTSLLLGSRLVSFASPPRHRRSTTRRTAPASASTRRAPTTSTTSSTSTRSSTSAGSARTRARSSSTATRTRKRRRTPSRIAPRRWWTL